MKKMTRPLHSGKKTKLKRFLFLSLFLNQLNTGFSQDTLFLRDGRKVVSKALKISNTEVTYKKVLNMDGPDYVEDKNEIESIKFANGTQEFFKKVQGNPAVKYTSKNYAIDFYKGQKNADIFVTVKGLCWSRIL